MGRIKKEIKVAVTVLLSLALLIWGLNYLKGVNVLSQSRQFYAIYPEIGGLSESSPIIINGLKVGTVKRIGFHPNYDGTILVQFSIEEPNFQIPEGTFARITSMDLLGSKSIELLMPTRLEGQEGTPAYLSDGDTLSSSMERSLTDEVNAQIAPLKTKAEDLLASIDTAVTVVRVILNKQARSDIRKSFESIKNTFLTFELVAKRVDSLMYLEKSKIDAIATNLQSITYNFRNNNENVTAILDNMRQISDSLSMSNLTSAVNNASEALTATSEIMRKIDEGEGTMGMLVNDDSLYLSLAQATKSLDKLLVDLEAHPKRYVHFSIFGRSDKKPKKKKEKNKDKGDN